MTDFDIASRRAAPVMEPDSAIEAKASIDSILSIVRLFRKAIPSIISYHVCDW